MQCGDALGFDVAFESLGVAAFGSCAVGLFRQGSEIEADVIVVGLIDGNDSPGVLEQRKSAMMPQETTLTIGG